jgi:predicted signal transduction protein with EAL and GGDEF domain
MFAMIQVLAKGLGMVTVAEGVEDSEQLDYVREIGCQYVQGYYYSKPLSFDDLLSKLEESENPMEWASKSSQTLSAPQASVVKNTRRENKAQAE